MERGSNMNIDTILLAEISENIRSLQLQLDYERAKIITALGGEPALYGTGNTLHAGTGSAIAGATMQDDGDIIIGDGAGGTKVKLSGTSGNIIPSQVSNSYNIADDAMVTFTPTRSGGLILIADVTATYANMYLSVLYNLTNNRCKQVYQTSTLWEIKENLDIATLSAITDGKMGISAYNGTIQIRNRSGVATVYLGLSILGARS